MIEIWQGGNDDPEKNFVLTQQTKRYMHVNINQIIKTYDQLGKETVTVNKVPVGVCPEERFVSDYEKKFYKQYGDSNMLCVDDASLYL